MKQSLSTIRVPKLYHMAPLVAFLADRLKVSKREAKGMIDARVVWVNGKLVWMAQHPLKCGDEVACSFKVTAVKKREQSAIKEKEHIRVLTQDESYLFADKPAGMLTQGADSVEARLRVQEQIPTLSAVHRLDRETSGVLMFAKNGAALAAAIEIFKTHKVKKVYNAVVFGSVERLNETLDLELDGKRAVSHVSRIQGNQTASFVKVKIDTGRTHQIRRHLAGIRHPILGDRQYGPKQTSDPRVLSVTRQMLHAVEVELPHPLQAGVHLKAHSPLPADFRNALHLFGLGKK